MEKKVCSKCKEEKELSEYNKGRNRCKLCIKEYNKEYYKKCREKNKDKRNQYARLRSQSDPIFKLTCNIRKFYTQYVFDCNT